MVNKSINYRQFDKKDMKQVLDLYTEAVGSKLKFERNQDFILALTEYPGVNTEGTIVAEFDGEIVAFFILSIIDNDSLLEGHVLDVVVKEEDDINQAIFNYIESSFIDKGVDVIVTAGGVANDTLTNNDWLTIKDRAFMTYPLQLAPVIKEVMEYNNGLSDYKVVFETEKEIICIKKQKENVLLLESTEDIKNVIVIKASAAVLWSIMLRNSSPSSNIIKGKLKVPINQFFFSIKLLREIILPHDFDLSISDHF